MSATAARSPAENTCTPSHLTQSLLLDYPVSVAGGRFDHRNGSMLRDWIVSEHIGGPRGLGDPAISGFFVRLNRRVGI